MSRRTKPLNPLHDEQSLAADPRAHVAVSASAGTGKTQVLTARVFRLLLGGVAPETILCLTFTKAGAAEMANRIGARLAAWVRMRDQDLRKDLFAIGERSDDPVTLQRARQLFARVLDAPGGLRIQTIHSFAQTLLASFPAEAGIAPGFTPIEGRAEAELVRRTLAELAAAAEASGDSGLLEDLQALSLRFGERDAEKYLAACARAGEAMAELGPRELIEPALRQAVGLPEGDVEAMVAQRCHDGHLDCALLRAIAAANLDWGTATGAAHAEAIDRWLALDAAGRASSLAALAAVFLTGKGEPRKTSPGQVKAMAHYEESAAAMVEAIGELLALRSAAALVALQAAGLRAGQAFAAAYERAKRAAGVADFNDLIGWTRKLLETPGMGDWVRFKLDRRTDHLLVDEAQDTNDDQWAIVKSLVGDFFTGSSEAEQRWRTVFTVGDFKQAIFSFQGTNPREYEAMRRWMKERTDALREGAAGDPEITITEFRDVPISASFRSAPAVLEVVDGVIRELGHEALGLSSRPKEHVAYHSGRPGRVEWWPPFEPAVEDESDEPDDSDSGEEGWLDERDRLFADHLARQVKSLIAEAPVLASTRKPLGPGDILVLVRSRAELASLIVARLFKEGVPVAGIDRLHLHRPLAVKDLLSAIAFAVQPFDDLNLANLLVSPLIGWSQDDLYDHAFGRGGSLWGALLDREGEGGAAAEALALLRVMLAMTDFTTPARFLEEVLSGSIDGRRKLLGRLGEEARDPIEELVTAALEFERAEVPSLDRFLAWFASGDVEIKRDPAAAPDAVRVMTVHGAKGLEAPVVILADATADPAQLGPKNAPLDFPVAGRAVPLVRPRKAERCPPFAALIEDQERLDLEEHWRLLYVALTRAEERLIVTGVRKRRDAPNCWHRVVGQALAGLGAERGNDGSLVHATGTPPASARAAPGVVMPDDLPDWLRRPAPDEPVPVRPLAPSALAGDDSAFPPPRPGEIDAARRGTLLHLLFERLPGVAPGQREAAALAWLEHSAGLKDRALREEIGSLACALISDPAHRELFAPGALAEAPIAATLPDGRVVAGTVDRLLVEPGRVRLVDFKTGSRVPASAADVPLGHRLQMEAYRDALAVIFPGRTVEAALLYTAGPKMVDLDG